jgi:hypothetical protein
LEQIAEESRADTFSQGKKLLANYIGSIQNQCIEPVW